MAQNPGLPSRFPHTLHFANYDVDDLDKIGQQMMSQRHFVLASDAKKEWVAALSTVDMSGNARSVRNLVDSVIKQQSLRLAARMTMGVDSSLMSSDELGTITGEDIKTYIKIFEKDQVEQAASRNPHLAEQMRDYAFA